MNRKFYIYWESPNIDEFIELEEIPKNITDIFNIHLIDGNAFNERISFETDDINKKYPQENIRFFCNQNLVQHLYKNKHYSDFLILENYENDIKNAYNKIYTEFLIPKENVKEIIQTITSKFNIYEKIIGVHIRTGDIYMGVGTFFAYTTNNLESNLKIICDYILQNNSGNYAIFVTSDYANIDKIFNKFLPNITIFYHDIDIIHIDMIKESDNISNGLLKLFADHITLTLCNETITHSNTNFGRTAALISNGEKFGVCYDEFISPVTIKKLSSKYLFI